MEGFLPGVVRHHWMDPLQQLSQTQEHSCSLLTTNIWLSQSASFETGSYLVSRRRAGVKRVTRGWNKKSISVAGTRLPLCSGNPVLDSAADTLHWALGAHGCAPAASCQRVSRTAAASKPPVFAASNRNTALQNKSLKNRQAGRQAGPGTAAQVPRTPNCLTLKNPDRKCDIHSEFLTLQNLKTVYRAPSIDRILYCTENAQGRIHLHKNPVAWTQFEATAKTKATNIHNLMFPI